MIADVLQGTEIGVAARKVGLPAWMQRRPGEAFKGEVKDTIERLQKELVEHTLEVGLVNAQEIHEYLSDCLRADMRDIRNEDGSFKPQSEWPDIWGRMMEAGDVEVEYEYDRSHDGSDQEKRGGWDKSGEVRKVKLKFGSKSKFLELLMKHKAVNAMVEPKQGDVHVHVHAEVRKRLNGALAREQRAIEAKAEPENE